MPRDTPSSPVANLIFAAKKPNLADLPPADESVIVPMCWEILALPELQKYQVVNPAKWLSGDLARQMQKRLDCEWSQFLTESVFDTASDYSFCFYITLCPLLYWEHIVDSAIKEFSPQVIWLPITPESYSVNLSSDFLADRAKFLTWALNATLERAAQNSEVKYFSEKPFFYSSRLLLRRQRFLALPLSRKAKVLGVWARRSTKRTLTSFFQFHATRSPLLIVSQPRKSEILRELLDEARITYHFESYAQFEARLGIAVKQKIFLTSGQHTQSPIQELSRWLTQTIKFLYYEKRQELESAADCHSILVHDAAHHPLIRALTRSFIQRNKEVVYIPEGAQYPSDQSWPYVRNMWGSAVGQTHFALSEGEVDFYRKQKVDYHQTVITGYFGKFPQKVNGIGRHKVEFQAKNRHEPKVFLDQFLFSETNGLDAPSSSYFEWFPEILGLIKTLRSYNFETISNSRDFLAMQRLESASGGGLRIRYGLDWYEVAESCDVVISADSSIILESLALFKPVVVYHPPWYREYENNYSAKYEAIKSDVMKFVSTPEGAVAAIRELVDSPKMDFQKYEYFLAQETWRAVDWIKATMQSPDRV